MCVDGIDTLNEMMNEITVSSLILKKCIFLNGGQAFEWVTNVWQIWSCLNFMEYTDWV